MKRKEIGKISGPLPERSLNFRGVRFFTRNLGATDPFSKKFVWFATGCWTHDKADGVFSDLTAAVADRFDLWEDLGLAYAPKFRTAEQLEKVKALESDISQAESA
jgi:hypothetical protein